MPVILPATAEGIDQAVACLRGHQPVVMPTETVYGLAAGTTDPEGVARIYQLKCRPSTNPLIAHVADAAMATTVVDGFDERAKALAAAFWPGPLTMILPRKASVPAIAAGGLDSLAVRVPSHAGAMALLEAYGGPLSAPSANRSGCVSPTSAQHVAVDYQDVDEATTLVILDGGSCTVGVESTVLSLMETTAVLLRPGSVRRTQIEGVIGPIDEHMPWAQGAAPGSSPRHYAPRTPLTVFAPDADTTAFAGTMLTLPDTPQEAQAALFDMLRQADAAGHDALGIVLPPDEPQWRAIRDRLLRAAATDQ